MLQLHRDLYNYGETQGGRWKPVDNEISDLLQDGARRLRFQPVAAAATPEYMQRLHSELGRLWRQDKVEKLLLIPAYVLAFTRFSTTTAAWLA